MDVTKVSRLISKVIAVAKYDNSENLEYDNIPEVPVIPMNADTIQALNDWQADLSEYLGAYKHFQTVQHEDYSDYRTKYNKIDYNSYVKKGGTLTYEEFRAKYGELRLEPIPVAPNPKDAKMMAEVPYTPGLELYKAGDLGLVRIDEFLRQNVSDEEEGEETEDEDDMGEGRESAINERRRAFINQQKQALVGQAVHTEFGDGIIKSLAVKSKKLNVVLPSGYLVRVSTSAAFVITKPTVSAKSMRHAILTNISDMPVTAPTGVLGDKFRIDNVGMRKAAKEREIAEKEAKREKETKRSQN